MGLLLQHHLLPVLPLVAILSVAMVPLRLLNLSPTHLEDRQLQLARIRFQHMDSRALDKLHRLQIRMEVDPQALHRNKHLLLPLRPPIRTGSLQWVVWVVILLHLRMARLHLRKTRLPLPFQLPLRQIRHTGHRLLHLAIMALLGLLLTSMAVDMVNRLRRLWLVLISMVVAMVNRLRLHRPLRISTVVAMANRLRLRRLLLISTVVAMVNPLRRRRLIRLEGMVNLLLLLDRRPIHMVVMASLHLHRKILMELLPLDTGIRSGAILTKGLWLFRNNKVILMVCLLNKCNHLLLPLTRFRSLTRPRLLRQLRLRNIMLLLPKLWCLPKLLLLNTHSRLLHQPGTVATCGVI